MTEMENIMEREYPNIADRTITFGCGKVTLISCSPDFVIKGRGCDVAAVQAARISYGNGLKSKKEDDALIEYLFENHHTSPFEMITFTFLVEVPLAVRTHFIRHRTARLNEFSQRYSEISDDDSSIYYPSKAPNGIRLQSKTGNKQLSQTSNNDEADLDKIEKIKALAKKAEDKIDEIKEIYMEMNELGCAKEISRFYLPSCTMTKFYYNMDLHNLIGFLSKRYDIDHTQFETYEAAKAMYELIKPLCPVTMKCYDNSIIGGLTLSRDDINALKTNTIPKGSKRKVDTFLNKKRILTL